jgi:hypothetical protein
MDGSFVADAQSMSEAVRVFRSRSADGFAQRLSKKILTRYRLNRDELVRMRLLEGRAQLLLINPPGLAGNLVCILLSHRPTSDF